MSMSSTSVKSVTKRAIVPALVGLLLIVAAAETFWRTAARGDLWKAICFLIAVAGVLFVGWQRLSLPAHLALNAAVGALCGMYLAFAATRYSGLLKEGLPPDAAALLAFFTKWAVIVFVAASLATLTSSLFSRYRHPRNSN